MFVRCVAQITLLSVYSSWRKMSYRSLCHFWGLLKAAGVVCSARDGWSMIQTSTSRLRCTMYLCIAHISAHPRKPLDVDSVAQRESPRSSMNSASRRLFFVVSVLLLSFKG